MARQPFATREGPFSVAKWLPIELGHWGSTATRCGCCSGQGCYHLLWHYWSTTARGGSAPCPLLDLSTAAGAGKSTEGWGGAKRGRKRRGGENGVGHWEAWRLHERVDLHQILLSYSKTFQGTLTEIQQYIFLHGPMFSSFSWNLCKKKDSSLSCQSLCRTVIATQLEAKIG